MAPMLTTSMISRPNTETVCIALCTLLVMVTLLRTCVLLLSVYRRTYVLSTVFRTIV
jgi:hypothetical protein